MKMLFQFLLMFNEWFSFWLESVEGPEKSNPNITDLFEPQLSQNPIKSILATEMAKNDIPHQINSQVESSQLFREAISHSQIST